MIQLLINRFQEWRAERIRRAHADEFCRGYRYAVDCLRGGMESPETHLLNMVDTACLLGDYNHFDKGVNKALKDMRS